MKKNLLFAWVLMFLSFPVFANEFNVFWKRSDADKVVTAGTRYLFPARSLVYTLNTTLFANELSKLSEDPKNGLVIALPTPGGSFQNFKVWQTPIMDRSLAAKYPTIRTYTATAVSDVQVTAKLDFTVKGFHAMIFDGANTYFIDPYSNINDGNYIVYYKKDYQRTAAHDMSCAVIEDEGPLRGEAIQLPGNNPNPELINGTTKRSYRLALACTAEYAAAVDGPTPTKPGVLSAMVTSMNRVNGVYERELAITMILIANNDTLIYLANPDPYTNGNANTIVTENQTNTDAIIGNGNYDIGHIFSTGAGGFAPGRVCNNPQKARAVTGRNVPIGDPFDIDYVAHEMGHQFSASHTFNASTGSCSGNGSSMSAFEPGSGSTIMAYAGICTSNNLQQNSDDYFHIRSLEQIINYVNGTGGTCAVTATTGNTPPVIPPFQQQYNIPFLTPFELIAPEAQDTEHDAPLTYCWEQWNRGDFTLSFVGTRVNGPIFRSLRPTASRTRVFTKLDTLLDNVTFYLGEKLPDTGRWLTFRLTVRDIYQGLGSINTSDDSIGLNVVYTGTPFKVTHPDLQTSIIGGSPMNVTWDVSSTDQAPINCSNVDILMSDDGGYTYPHVLASGTANDGSETVIVPAITTSTARVKIKGVGNVFFDLSNQNFSIVSWQLGVANISERDVHIYPVPAKDEINIEVPNKEQTSVMVTNTLGQRIFTGTMCERMAVKVSDWSKGVYYLTIQQKDGNKIVKPILVQ